MNINVTINAERELYVIPSGGGYTCMGFDNVLRELRLIAARIKGFAWVSEALASAARGSLEAYALYCGVLDDMARKGIQSDTWFAEGTDPKVARVLERCRKDGNQVRLWFGDPITGCDGLEEYEVYGRIGRSSGTIRAPLLCTDAYGGGVLSSNRVLRIVDVATRKELYRHPKWHLPNVELQPIADTSLRAKGYTVEALVEGITHARFRDTADAAYWLAMMHGRSLENPGFEAESEALAA